MTNKGASAHYDEHITSGLVSAVCPFGRTMTIAKDMATAFGQFGLVANRFSENHGFLRNVKSDT